MGDWLRVGDLGYMAEGELFVTGRSNEVIVRLGQKYHPEDIEQAVQRADWRYRPAAAWPSHPWRDDKGTWSSWWRRTARRRPRRRGERRHHQRRSGSAPSQVLLVPKGTIPTTPNGKLQRRRAREMHQRGELPLAAEDPAPPGS